MVNVAKHIAYWANGAREDWEVAQELIKHKRVRHGLFFTHLALEKALKAHVTRYTRDIAPRIHDLEELARRAALALTEKQAAVLAEINEFNIRGRCPESYVPAPDLKKARDLMLRTKEIFEWWLSQL